MDELLSFMEEDLEYETEEESQNTDTHTPPVSHPSSYHSSGSGNLASPLKSQNVLSPTPTFVQPTKNLSNLTFNDVFGSPDKRDVEDLGLDTKTVRKAKRFSTGPSPTSYQSSSSISSKSQVQSSELHLSKLIRQDANVPYRPDSTIYTIDPYSLVRVVKSSISIYYDESMTAEAALKDRNIGLEFVSLSTFSTWYRGKGKDTKNFWVSGVLTRKTSGVRKSAKGNDYSIWEINNLRDLDKTMTVFLFGSSSGSSTLTATPIGSLVDVTTPSVMQDASSGTSKLSINNASQVRFIGTSKDFGYCKAKKRDGNKCTVVVNTWECSFCIHHASGELKKLNIGSKRNTNGQTKGKTGNTSNGQFSSQGYRAESQESLKQQGIYVANFGKAPETNKSWSHPNPGITSASSSTSSKRFSTSSRMNLQGSSNEMKKNPLKYGNPDTVKFVKNTEHPLFKNQPLPAAPQRKPLDLDPSRTRHLTNKDRDLLMMLESKATTTQVPAESEPKHIKKGVKTRAPNETVSELITTSIVNNPNAASKNFMQFLTLQHAPKDQVDMNSNNNKSTAVPALTMSREKLLSMKKALAFVQTNGPIRKNNPNSTPGTGTKRKLQESSGGKTEPRKKQLNTKACKIDVEFDFESDDFKKILNAKSAHDDELDEIQHEEYFEKLEKKEALENKLLNTFSIDTNAVMCRQCKYVALSQSEFCKERLHQVRLVKARKRFFKCKDCGNRTMSLDRLPKRPCSNCNNSSWLVAPVGKERKGPKLASEMLAVRGNEETFIGSAGSKMFLHLEV